MNFNNVEVFYAEHQETLNKCMTPCRVSSSKIKNEEGVIVEVNSILGKPLKFISNNKDDIKNLYTPASSHVIVNNKDYGEANRFYSKPKDLLRLFNVVTFDFDCNIQDLEERLPEVYKFYNIMEVMSFSKITGASNHVTFLVKVDDDCRDWLLSMVGDKVESKKYNCVKFLNGLDNKTFEKLEVLPIQNHDLYFGLNDKTLFGQDDGYYHIEFRSSKGFLECLEIQGESKEKIESFILDFKELEPKKEKKPVGRPKKTSEDNEALGSIVDDEDNLFNINTAIKFMNARRVYDLYGFGPGQRHNEAKKLLNTYRDNPYLGGKEFINLLNGLKKYDPEIESEALFSGDWAEEIREKIAQPLPEKITVESITTKGKINIKIKNKLKCNFILFGQDVSTFNKELSYVILDEVAGYKVNKFASSCSPEKQLAELGERYTISGAMSEFLVVSIDDSFYKMKLDKPYKISDIRSKDQTLFSDINRMHPGKISNDLIILNNYHVKQSTRFARDKYNSRELPDMPYEALPIKLRNTLENVLNSDLYTDGVHKNLFLLASSFVYNQKIKQMMCLTGTGGIGKDTLIDLLGEIYGNDYTIKNKGNFSSEEIKNASLIYYQELKIDSMNKWDTLKIDIENRFNTSEVKFKSAEKVSQEHQSNIASVQCIDNIAWVLKYGSEVKAFTRRMNIIENSKALPLKDINGIDKLVRGEIKENAELLAYHLYYLVKNLSYREVEEKKREIEREIEDAMDVFASNYRDGSYDSIIKDIIEDKTLRTFNEFLLDYSPYYRTGDVITWPEIKDCLIKLNEGNPINDRSEPIRILRGLLFEGKSIKNTKRLKWSYKYLHDENVDF